MKDHEHPFFRPLWRRIAIVAVCLVWAALEYAGGSTGWSLAALGVAAYGVWQFFYLYRPPAETGDPAAPDSKE